MAIAILNASQLLTLRGPARPRRGLELRELAIIRDGGMLVEGEKIAAVGASAEIERALPVDCEVLDVGGRVVAPGFVDAHTHPVFGGDRLDDFERRAAGMSYEQIAAAGGGIWSTVRQTRNAADDQLLVAGLRNAERFLACGTTTIEAKSGYGLTLEDELRLLRTIRQVGEQSPLRVVPTFLGAHAVPPETDARTYADLVIREMLPAVEGLALNADVFCEAGYFDVELSRAILTAARSHGLKLRIHADQLTLSGGAQLAAELRAQTADHLEHVDEQGIHALGAAGVQPVLLPGSAYYLGGKRYAPARKMIDAGLAVVLATDFNPGSSPTPSMPMVLSLACTQMGMSPAEAVTAATVNAAYSLDLGDRIGTLEAGKQADFAVFDCDDYREVVAVFGAQRAWEVFVGGRRAAMGDSNR